MSEIKLAPVIIFAFNRPHHVYKTLESLSKCNKIEKTQLIAFVDAPRTSIENFKVDAVKKIIKQFRSNFLSLTIHTSKANEGCDASIRKGIDKVFEIYDRAIILEDDIVVGKNFLESMNIALEEYHKVKKVFHINAYNFNVPKMQKGVYKNRFFLFRAMLCWGWATWRDRWQSWNDDPLSQDVFSIMNSLGENKNYFNLDGCYNWWNQLEANANGELDNTWDILWFSFIQKENGLCLTPYFSLVRNIGFDRSGVHCNPLNSMNLDLINNSLVDKFPTNIEETEHAIKMIKSRLRFMKVVNLPRKIKFIFKNLIFKIKNFLKK